MSQYDRRQFAIPMVPEMTPIALGQIAVLPSMTKAIQMAQTLSGLDDAQFYGPGGVVEHQAQWSRIKGGGPHHFPQDKLNMFMDKCQNEAPMLYLLHSRGYDLSSLRKAETETEKKCRLLREENAALRRVLMAGSAA